MINITDIRKRLLENPEPTEVKEIRNLITSSFKDLEFFEEPHKYILHSANGTDTELPSVSGIIHQFEPHKDWDRIRKNKASREGIDPEDLKRAWRENNLLSTSNGSKTHFFLENLMKLWVYGESSLDQEVSHYQYEDGFLIPYGPKEAAGVKFYEEMVLRKPDIYPIMPEAKIYTGLTPEFSFRQEYCGTFDLLFGKKDPRTGKILPFLADWKTNKSLTNDYARSKHQMMLPPFQDFYDEPLSHYTLQLSCYQMGIQQLGLPVTHRIIVWLKEDGSYELIPVPDVTDRLKTIL